MTIKKKVVAKKPVVKKRVVKKVTPKKAIPLRKNPITYAKYVVDICVGKNVGYFVKIDSGGIVFDSEQSAAYLFNGKDGHAYAKLMRDALEAWTKAKKINGTVSVKKFEGGAGRKPNPVPPSKIAAAADLRKRFTGHETGDIYNVDVNWPTAGLTIGECDGIMYTTVRDSVTEKYVHEFKKSARPLLVASHDGASLALIGGNFTFTERGITDN